MINNPVLHKELFMRLRLRQMPKPVKIGVLVIAISILTIFYGIILVRYDRTHSEAGAPIDDRRVLTGFHPPGVVSPHPTLGRPRMDRPEEGSSQASGCAVKQRAEARA